MTASARLRELSKSTLLAIFVPMKSDKNQEQPGMAAPWSARWWSISMVTLGVAFAWSYWPELAATVKVWQSDPDYSHGFLVVPIAAWFLWTRRDTVSWGPRAPAIGGLVVLLLASALRYLADRYFVYEVAAWSMVVWLAGACWLMGGWRFFRWSLPALGFLVFAMKVPLRYERALSGPMQTIATDCSCWVLQLLAIPAFAQGNTILIGDDRLEVAQACAGLRMTLGVFALAYAFSLLLPRPWWQKVAIWVLAAPVAILANTLRIVATGLLYHFHAGDVLKSVGHDFAGLVVIPVAAGLMAMVLWFLGNATKQHEIRDTRGVAT